MAEAANPMPNVPTVDDYLELIGLPIGGAVWVSLGLVSDIRDVERFPRLRRADLPRPAARQPRAAAAAALLTGRARTRFRPRPAR
jgi:hypothetical protein